MRPRVGIIGFRGMVGSVLLERMLAERDFDLIEPRFFSSSQHGARAPDVGRELSPVADAGDLAALAECEILISSQGSDYTKDVHPRLRAAGYQGYWIDAASALRMDPSAVIILDPVNRALIDAAIARGTKDFIGGNCTVSLSLMAVHGLIEAGWVEWISAMTYQAASGAGARPMRELVEQMGALARGAANELANPAASALEIDRAVMRTFADPSFPTQAIGVPLAGSLIPWIDREIGRGQTKEEWKASAEATKILGMAQPLRIDGVCVRVGVMRCHSQALTLKLVRDIPLAEIEARVRASNDWVTIVPNDEASTRAGLSPAAVSGTLRVALGRLRKATLGPDFLSCFTVGDQLLWGAAEPLRRMLRILVQR